jgi:hypothetical protein
MRNTWILAVTLLILAMMLVHYRPVEGYANKKKLEKLAEEFANPITVDPRRAPACTARSSGAQHILASIASLPESDEGAAELRLLLSKLCCIEADVSTAGAGVYRTLNLQFRTSHDMEPPTALVGRCLRNAMRPRDITLIMDKYEKRGKDLIRSRCSSPDNLAAFDQVVAATRLAMTSFCLIAQPSMDKPSGARDPGFWAPEDTDLRQYEGISSMPK